MRIVVFTEYGSNYAEIAAITIPIMKRYCEKQSYEFRELILDGSGGEYFFKKHEFIKDLFTDTSIEAAFYLDCDILITNMNVSVEPFIDNDFHFFITRDATELNGGAIILRNTDIGRIINDVVLEQKDSFDNEQNYYNSKKFRDLFFGYYCVLPHPSINSLKYSLYPECPEYVGREDLGDWRVGNFALHVPALGLNRRIEVLKNHVCHIQP